MADLALCEQLSYSVLKAADAESQSADGEEVAAVGANTANAAAAAVLSHLDAAIDDVQWVFGARCRRRLSFLLPAFARFCRPKSSSIHVLPSSPLSW